jgi:hypothetical protein
MNRLLQNIISEIKLKNTINYQDFDNLYNEYKGDKTITSLTQEQIYLVEQIFDISSREILGGYVEIKKENLYINNISSLCFNKFYPNIIKILTKCGKLPDFLQSFSYIIDNKNTIYDNLDPDERTHFNKILNYKFAHLGYINQNIVSTFGHYFMKYISSYDVYEDIVYIDTDQIFYNNYIETYNMIVEKTCGLFDIEIDDPSTYMFLQKKKYIKFDGDVSVKGIKLVENKNIKNHNYKIYLETYNGQKLSYSKINSASMREFYKKYIDEHKKQYDRKEKLKRVLYD